MSLRPAPDITGSLPDRYWAKVERRGPDDCWPWTGAVDEKGYGRVNSGGRGRPIKSHRIALLLATGAWPEAVLHRCDNPPCQNPAHLFDGDQPTNLADMRAKGRQAHGPALGAAISAGKQAAKRRRQASLSDDQPALVSSPFGPEGVS